MAQYTPITAAIRERAGKGAARATRRQGRVPAVIYGNKETPIMISVDPLDLKQQMDKQGFFTRLFELAVGNDSYKVLARDLQLHPVTDRPLHVDFMRFSSRTRLTIDVSVEFLNEEECPGVKAGGVVNVVRHTIELMVSPENMPDTIKVDLAGLEVGDSVHISHITLPEGVTPTITDRDFTIVTIAAPTLAPLEDEEEEVGEEEDEAEADEDKEAE